MADSIDDDRVDVDRSQDETAELGPAPPVASGDRRAPRATKPPSTAGASATTIGSPLEALERDEMLRTRRFCSVGISIALAGAASVPLVHGDATASAIILSAIAASVVAMVFLLFRTRDPAGFRRPSTLLGWFVPAVSVTTAIPFFGVFSPAPLLLVLGIYFTGLGRSRPLALAVYLTAAGVQAALSALVIAGAIRDPGLIHAGPLGVREQIVVQVLVQIVLGSTMFTARMSRRTALVAVGELESATRLAAHREALLLEAREELERALRSGRGRFTDQTIGAYRLGAVLGRGAMGEVYEARGAEGPSGPKGKFAVKLLSQTSLGNPHHVLRFLRELRTAQSIVSPNVVRVVDVGESPVPYLVMERLEGQTLGEMLRGKKALAPVEVVDLVAQIGAGITTAAAAGVVHRDLKPQNVFLHKGVWKILDFGVARAVDASDTLTAGHVVGTPSYMAPEQASGGAVDHATDLYALAAIAYRALTGHPPYAGGEIAETLYKVVHTVPRAPTELAPLAPELDLVLAIGLAKDPTARFTSAIDLVAALGQAVSRDLSPALRSRGEALVKAGAWATRHRRAPTSPLRRPR